MPPLGGRGHRGEAPRLVLLRGAADLCLVLLRRTHDLRLLNHLTLGDLGHLRHH